MLYFLFNQEARENEAKIKAIIDNLHKKYAPLVMSSDVVNLHKLTHFFIPKGTRLIGSRAELNGLEMIRQEAINVHDNESLTNYVLSNDVTIYNDQTNDKVALEVLTNNNGWYNNEFGQVYKIFGVYGLLETGLNKLIDFSMRTTAEDVHSYTVSNPLSLKAAKEFKKELLKLDNSVIPENTWIETLLLQMFIRQYRLRTLDLAKDFAPRLYMHNFSMDLLKETIAALSGSDYVIEDQNGRLYEEVKNHEEIVDKFLTYSKGWVTANEKGELSKPKYNEQSLPFESNEMLGQTYQANFNWVHPDGKITSHQCDIFASGKVIVDENDNPLNE